MNTHSLGAWRRVSKAAPCLVCEKPDWCLVSVDGAAALCQRVESPRRVGDAGCLHRLHPSSPPTGKRWVRPVLVVAQAATMTDGTSQDWHALAEGFVLDTSLLQLEALAEELGVTADSLRRLGVGWARAWRCWSFPLSDPGGHIVGINRRWPSGEKRIVRGGRVGLYLPNGLRGIDPLMIAEGGTDTAALLHMGFDAVGRFSCGTGARWLADLITLRHWRHAVIVADNDEAGRRGAEALAATLVLFTPLVQVVCPPDGFKDVRAWKRAGATAADLCAAIANARVVRLQFATSQHGGGLQ